MDKLHREEADLEKGTEAIGFPHGEESPEEEIASLKDKWLRALADQDNIRKRAQKSVEEARLYALTNFARDLLQIADALERALELPAPDGTESSPFEGIFEGVALVHQNLLNLMERHGIEPIPAQEGDPFDPHLHQAMMDVETSAFPPGTLAQVLQKGYRLHGRLLRPTFVGVAKAPQS